MQLPFFWGDLFTKENKLNNYQVDALWCDAVEILRNGYVYMTAEPHNSELTANLITHHK